MENNASGDYIAMKLTGEVNTTVSGLSEGIFWDFKENKISDVLMDYYGFDKSIIPEIVPTFSIQGKLIVPVAGKWDFRQEFQYHTGPEISQIMHFH